MVSTGPQMSGWVWNPDIPIDPTQKRKPFAPSDRYPAHISVRAWHQPPDIGSWLSSNCLARHNVRFESRSGIQFSTAAISKVAPVVRGASVLHHWLADLSQLSFLSCCITCGGTAHFFLWKVLFFKGQSTSMFTFANTIFQTFQYNLSLCVYVDTCIGDCLSLPTGYARNILYIILYIHYFSEQVKLPPACAKTVHLWPSAEYQVIASDKNLEKTNKTQKKLQTPCGISSKPSDMGLQFFCFLKVLATFAQLCQKPRENKKNTTSERNWERALNREYVLYKMPLLTFTRIQLWMRNQKEIDSWKDCWNSR